MWWMAAAAAAPYVMSALQKKPKRPNAPEQVQLKNRDGEIESALDMARDPNTQVWKLASDQAAEQVNRLLGRTGMGGSSLGAQLQGNTQSKLAQAWLEDQAQRQHRAMQMALEYDKNQAGWKQDQNNAAYNYGMEDYKYANQRNANQIQGMSNMINTGVQLYNQGRALSALEEAKKPPAAPPAPIYQTPADVSQYSIYDGGNYGFSGNPNRIYGGE